MRASAGFVAAAIGVETQSVELKVNRMPRKKAAARKEEKASFEESVAELQGIVGDLEDGSLPLEDSMNQFERGISLLRNCYQVLEQAEQRIELLTAVREDGTVETQPFDGGATFDGQSTSGDTESNSADDTHGDSLF